LQSQFVLLAQVSKKGNREIWSRDHDQEGLEDMERNNRLHYKKHSLINVILFKKALFGIWLCDNPAQKSLKREMLGTGKGGAA